MLKRIHVVLLDGSEYHYQGSDGTLDWIAWPTGLNIWQREHGEIVAQHFFAIQNIKVMHCNRDED